jgi:hypothetical protein
MIQIRFIIFYRENTKDFRTKHWIEPSIDANKYTEIVPPKVLSINKGGLELAESQTASHSEKHS